MKLAILDRIGASSREGEDFLVPVEEWLPQVGLPEAIGQLTRAGWHIVLASNQPGLGRGSFDVVDLNALHLRMQRVLHAAGARVEAVFFCPHTAAEQCTCRKPAPGLLQQAAARYGAEPHEVWVVSQETNHLHAGRAMGAHTVWVQLDAAEPLPQDLGDTPVYRSWQAVADALAPDAQVPAPPVAA